MIRCIFYFFALLCANVSFAGGFETLDDAEKYLGSLVKDIRLKGNVERIYSLKQYHANYNTDNEEYYKRFVSTLYYHKEKEIVPVDECLRQKELHRVEAMQLAELTFSQPMEKVSGGPAPQLMQEFRWVFTFQKIDELWSLTGLSAEYGFTSKGLCEGKKQI